MAAVEVDRKQAEKAQLLVQAHQKRVDATSGKAFKCKLCGRGFDRLDTCQRHVRCTPTCHNERIFPLDISTWDINKHILGAPEKPARRVRGSRASAGTSSANTSASSGQDGQGHYSTSGLAAGEKQVPEPVAAFRMSYGDDGSISWVQEEPELDSPLAVPLENYICGAVPSSGTSAGLEDMLAGQTGRQQRSKQKSSAARKLLFEN